MLTRPSACRILRVASGSSPVQLMKSEATRMFPPSLPSRLLAKSHGAGEV